VIRLAGGRVVEDTGVRDRTADAPAAT
jgi:hypothetical protein